MELVVSSRSGSTSTRNRKRFQNLHNAPQPLIFFDEQGTVVNATSAALKILRYKNTQSVTSCFFSLVHSKNLYHVMRDVADMVCHGKKQASWFLRMRLGTHEWHWFTATAYNYLSDDAGEIAVFLEPV